jgi:hypothetical protein
MAGQTFNIWSQQDTILNDTQLQSIAWDFFSTFVLSGIQQARLTVYNLSTNNCKCQEKLQEKYQKLPQIL